MTTKKKITISIIALYSLAFMMLIIGKSSYQSLFFAGLYILAVIALTWAVVNVFLVD